MKIMEVNVKTVIIILGALFLLFLALFMYCACVLAGEEDRREEALFAQWYASHTEEPDQEG